LSIEEIRGQKERDRRDAITLIFDDGGKTAGRIAIRTVAPLAGSGSGRGESPKRGMA